MKWTMTTLAVICCASLARCEEYPKSHYVLEAQVKDDRGAPVATASIQGAKVALKKEGVPHGSNVRIEAATDDKGKALLAFESLPGVGGVSIQKDGYYPSFHPVDWIRDTHSSDYKAVLKVALKPVKKPIAMYAFDNTGNARGIVKIPVIGESYGFDLMRGAALPPLGNGETSDFTFRVEGDWESIESYRLKLVVEFPHPKDGVVEFMTPQRRGKREPQMFGSRLISSYHAPEEGYRGRLVRITGKPEQKQDARHQVDFHRNYYFRCRTKTDDQGNIISANYGKIYGDFNFDAAREEWGYRATLLMMTTYFNPTPNDRNVEFDPKRNLNPDTGIIRP